MQNGISYSKEKDYSPEGWGYTYFEAHGKKTSFQFIISLMIQGHSTSKRQWKVS